MNREAMLMAIGLLEFATNFAIKVGVNVAKHRALREQNADGDLSDEQVDELIDDTYDSVRRL
jgi:hypothetical protein